MTLPSDNGHTLSEREWSNLLRRNQFLRWQRGERVLVEAFLEEHPKLGDDLPTLLDLIDGEILLREAAGEAVELGEYRERFPGLALPLERRFQILDSVALSRSDSNSGARSHLTLPVGPVDDRPATETFPAPEGYEIVEELGRGNMGVVYKARQSKLNRFVALKMILHADYASPEERLRFQREAEVLAALRHENIVQVFEVGELADKVFFSMELVEGGSLDTVLDGQPRNPSEAARFVATLARGIHLAHQKGIVHRDLKPGNILIGSVETGTGSGDLAMMRPAISDFGLAKRVDEISQTHTGAVLGTPAYMAPEQAGGLIRETGPTCDIYALGVMLYELLTGSPPFRAATVVDTLMQVMTEEPTPPSRLVPRLPRDLETVCLKCLEKEPIRRYSSAGELADDLDRFVCGEPVRVRPVGKLEKTWRWAARKPMVASLLAMVVVILLLGTSVASYFAWESSKRAEEAQRNADTARNNAAQARRAKDLAQQREGQAQEAKRQAQQQLTRAETLTCAQHLERAQRAWNKGDIAEAQRELDMCRWDYRVWEHSHLKKKFEGSVLTWHGHSLFGSAGVQLVGVPSYSGAQDVLWFTPDSKRIVLGAAVFDIGSGERIYPRDLLGSYSETVSRNGKVAIRFTNEQYEALEIDSGKVISTFPGNPNYGLNVQLNGDGSRVLFSTSLDPENSGIFVWETQSKKRLLSLSKVNYQRSPRLGPKGRYLAYVSLEQNLILYDIDAGKKIATFGEKDKPLDSERFSPDGRLLAARVGDSVKMWRVSDQKEVFSCAATSDSVHIEFDPDSRRLCLGLPRSATGELVQVWDWKRQEKVIALTANDLGRARTDPGDEFNLSKPPVAPPVALDHLGRLVVGDARIGVWMAERDHLIKRVIPGDFGDEVWKRGGSGSTRLFALLGHTLGPTDPNFEPEQSDVVPISPEVLAVSPDGQWIVSYASDGLKLWQANCEPGHRTKSLSGEPVLASKRPVLVLPSPKGPTEVWNLDEPTRSNTLHVPDQARCNVTALSSDGLLLAGAISARVTDKKTKLRRTTSKFFLVDTLTGKVRTELGQLSDASVTAFAFDSSGRTLAIGDSKGRIHVWDLAKRTRLRAWPTKGTAPDELRFSDDDSRLICADTVFVSIWDHRTSRQLVRVEARISVVDRAGNRVLGLLPKPKTDAIGLNERMSYELRMWEVATGKSYLLQSNSPVSALALDPRNEQLASGTRTGEIVLWDLASRKQVHTLRGHKNTIASLAFSPDGSRLVSAEGRAFDWVDDLGGLGIGKEDRVSYPFEPEERSWYTSLVDDEPREKKEEFNPLGFPGEIVAERSETSAIKVWDLRNRLEVHQLTSPTRLVERVFFSADGRHLVAYGPLEDGTESLLRVWSANTEPTAKPLLLHGKTIPSRGALFSRDGRYIIASTSRPREIDWLGVPDEPEEPQDATERPWGVWDNHSGQVVTTGPILEVLDFVGKESFPFDEFHEKFPDFAFSPDRSRLAASEGSSEDLGASSIAIWDTATREKLRTLEGKEVVLISLEWMRNGNNLVAYWDTLIKGIGLDIVTSPVVTGSDIANATGTCNVWNVSTGEELYSSKGNLFEGDMRVGHLGVVPRGDGFQFLHTEWDRKLQTTILDLESNDTLVLPRNHSIEAFRGDGKRFVYTSDDKIFVLCDGLTGKPIRTLGKPLEQAESPNDVLVRFSPNYRHCVLITKTALLIFDAETGTSSGVVELNLESRLTNAHQEFAPDGDFLAVNTQDKKLVIVDLVQAALVQEHKTNDSPRILFCKGSERYVFSVGSWLSMVDSYKNPNPKVTQLKNEFVYSSTASAFCPGGGYLALTDKGRGEGIRLWDLSQNVPIRVTLKLPDPRQSVGEFPGASLAFSSDGRYLVAHVDRPEELLVWDLETRKLLPKDKHRIAPSEYPESYFRRTMVVDGFVPKDAIGWRRGPEISADRTKVAYRFSDSTVRVWDTRSRKLIRSIEDNPGPIEQIEFTPDSKRLLLHRSRQRLVLRDGRSGRELSAFDRSEVSVRRAFFSPDERSIVCLGNRVVVLDSDTFRPRHVPHFEGQLRTWHLDSDHGLLACVFGDHVSITKTDTLEETACIETPEPIRTVLLHPPSQRLATIDRKNRIVIWNLQTAKRLTQISGSYWLLQQILFSPDGERLILGEDSLLSSSPLWVWSVPEGKLLFVKPSLGVFLSPSGKYLYTGMTLLDLRTGAEVTPGTAGPRSAVGGLGGLGGLEIGLEASIPSYSPDGRSCIALDAWGQPVVWPLATPSLGPTPSAR